MNPIKLLLVDDEEDLLFAVKTHLEAKGYLVSTAKDGNDALNKARSEQPDLIILDLMIPKINGYKVCRMLKFDEKYKKIPVIIFTARVQEYDEKLGYEVGADAYIKKPFESRALLDKINELLKDR